MVKTIISHQCEECGGFYATEEDASECEKYCRNPAFQKFKKEMPNVKVVKA